MLYLFINYFRLTIINGNLRAKASRISKLITKFIFYGFYRVLEIKSSFSDSQILKTKFNYFRKQFTFENLI